MVGQDRTGQDTQPEHVEGKGVWPCGQAPSTDCRSVVGNRRRVFEIDLVDR